MADYRLVGTTEPPYKVKVYLCQAGTSDVTRMGVSICHSTRGEEPRKCSAVTLRKVLWEYDHKSVAEHTVVSYLLVDCSKVLTHQLVRHRLASYTQLSDRHSETPSVEDVILPLGRLDYIWPTYVSLLKKIRVMEQEGVDRELLRYLYPCGVRTSIIITANVREWLHIISERTCKLAQEEIRGVMLLIARSLQELYPSMTAEIGPPCVVDHCTHGSASCGEPYSKPFP